MVQESQGKILVAQDETDYSGWVAEEVQYTVVAQGQKIDT